MSAYSESMEDAQDVARDEERQVLRRSIDLMEESDRDNINSVKRIEAIIFVTRVWSHFLNDLAAPENISPNQIKADLISIGIFIMRYVERMRKDKELAFEPVIEITTTIHDGLSHG